MNKETHTESCRIIDALGGTSATARLCNVEPPAVTQWRYAGIPEARLMYLKLAMPAVFKTPKSDASPKAAEPV